MKLWIAVFYSAANIIGRFYVDFIVFKSIDCSNEENKEICIYFWSATIISIAIAVSFDISSILLIVCRHRRRIKLTSHGNDM